MNPLLKQMLNHAEDDLRAAIEDNEGTILKDIADARANMDDEEKDLVFSCSFAIKLNLDKSSVETALAWAAKRKVKGVHRLDTDPTPPLPGIVTIERHGEKVWTSDDEGGHA